MQFGQTAEQRYAAAFKARQDAAAAALAEQRRKEDYDRRVREEQILYLTLLAQNGPVTEVTQPTTGNDITAVYTELFRNNTNNPVRLQVFADFVNPGVGVILSTSADVSDNGKVDELALIANGRTESVQIIVLPTYSLWVKDRDPTFFPMQQTDVVRVRVFDPAKLVSYGNLYPRRG
jgi:hypothetical protein